MAQCLGGYGCLTPRRKAVGSDPWLQQTTCSRPRARRPLSPTRGEAHYPLTSKEAHYLLPEKRAHYHLPEKRPIISYQRRSTLSPTRGEAHYLPPEERPIISYQRRSTLSPTREEAHYLPPEERPIRSTFCCDSRYSPYGINKELSYRIIHTVVRS